MFYKMCSIDTQPLKEIKSSAFISRMGEREKCIKSVSTEGNPSIKIQTCVTVKQCGTGALHRSHIVKSKMEECDGRMFYCSAMWMPMKCTMGIL